MFALSFALGVVSGVTMSFQFGTNWPGFMERVGNVAGPLLGLRGADRVLPRGGLPRHHAVRPRPRQRARAPDGDVLRRLRHHAQRVLDPGAQLVDADADRPRGRRTARSIVASWWQVLFNPSFPYRFTHMLLASTLTCAFLLSGLRRLAAAARRGRRSAPKVLRVGLTLAAIADPAADRRRRPARPEHARAPAAEDRGDGRHLAHRARRAAAAVRDAPTARRARTTSRSRCPSSAA